LKDLFVQTSNPSWQKSKQGASPPQMHWAQKHLQPGRLVVGFWVIPREIARWDLGDTEGSGDLSGACYGIVSRLADPKFERTA
jgi:hypothetical protein